MVHAFNPSTWFTEAAGSLEFKTRLVYNKEMKVQVSRGYREFLPPPKKGGGGKESTKKESGREN